MKPLWEKSTPAEDWVIQFTTGEDYRWDTLLLPYDLEATYAHAWGLAQIGVLSPDEFDAVGKALDALLEREIVVRPEDEDAHTVIERLLTEAVGEPGKKIHTGRSRNDQVLAALRLYLRDAPRTHGGAGGRFRAHAVPVGKRVGQPAHARIHAHATGHAHDAGALGHGIRRGARGGSGTAARGRRSGERIPPGIGCGLRRSAPGATPARRSPAGWASRDSRNTSTAVQLSRGKLELDVVHALVQTLATFNRLCLGLRAVSHGRIRFREAAR